MSKRSDSDSSLPPEGRRVGKYGRLKPSDGRVEITLVGPNWARALREQHAKKLAEEAAADKRPEPEEK